MGYIMGIFLIQWYSGGIHASTIGVAIPRIEIGCQERQTVPRRKSEPGGYPKVNFYFSGWKKQRSESGENMEWKNSPLFFVSGSQLWIIHYYPNNYCTVD